MTPLQYIALSVMVLFMVVSAIGLLGSFLWWIDHKAEDEQDDE